MSGSPTFDTGKKTQKRGEFKTPPYPTGRRSNKQNYTCVLGNTRFISRVKHDISLVPPLSPELMKTHTHAKYIENIVFEPSKRQYKYTAA